VSTPWNQLDTSVCIGTGHVHTTDVILALKSLLTSGAGAGGRGEREEGLALHCKKKLDGAVVHLKWFYSTYSIKFVSFQIIHSSHASNDSQLLSTPHAHAHCIMLGAM
jgi:hypothetical protein